MAAQTPEQRELTLVGKVEMRIALADTDDKLAANLKIYLAPLLLKLASEHASVRNKVVSVCQHINTRIKPESIGLPVAVLIQQFKEQQTPLVRHFDIIYIQQGIDRLSSTEKASLLPIVIGGVAKAGNHAPQIFNLFLRLLEHFTLPMRGSKDDTELRAKYELSDGDAAAITQWVGKLILYTPGRATCPGLTKEECDFLSLQGKPETWSPSSNGLNILRTKMLSLRLLSSGLFKEEERFIPALYATADPASTISELGEDLMKRTLPSVVLESQSTIDPLFRVYFGGAGRPRAAPMLRVKVLGLLLKSTKSTMYSEHIVSITEDGISPPDADGEDVSMANGITRAPGRQAMKLRTAVFEYINFVARYGPKEVLQEIAPKLVRRLQDFIENQGWPKPGLNEDLGTRAYAYEVIALLIRAGPVSLLLEDEHPTAELLRWLFTSLASDASDGSTIVSIEESLSTVLGTMSRWKLTQAQQTVVEDLLIEQCELSADLKTNNRLRSTRFAAVRFANRCLPFDSVKARWINLVALGAADERLEVKEESERGLSPYWYLMLKGANGLAGDEQLSFPAFHLLISQLFPCRDVDTRVAAERLRQQYPSSFGIMLAFAQKVLYQDALAAAHRSLALTQDWERSLENAVDNDQAVRLAIKKYIAQEATKHKHELELYQAALFQQIVHHGVQGSSSLVQHLALAPEGLIEQLTTSVIDLIPIITSNSHDARLGAAHCFGLLVSHPAMGSRDKLIQDLVSKASTWKSASGAQVNQVHGSLVALGYALSRMHHKGLLDRQAPLAHSFTKEIIITMLLEVTDASLKEGIYLCLGQLSIFGALNLDDTATFKQAIDKIYATAKTGDERAIICLGQLAMGCASGATDEALLYVQERLHDLHEVRQAEVHFSVGEAFSYLACGWQSTALATKLDVGGPAPDGYDRAGVLARLTDDFVKDCANTKPSLKKAAVMWLLCLVQYCGHLPEMQTKLAVCQAAFKRCLVDRDELVQESASRGLGLVYEKGDRSLKDDLVRDLVSSFSSDKQASLAGTVSADTQLFEPGALPTGDGSVSTYKDIMSLASEVGDSSLVYRFMSMASSNAIWSSRAAFGRFGLSNVLSDSSVDGYLADNPKLYPKLYRYRFDPNSGVRRSMNDIWNALVKDSASTIDKHFDAIIQDLLISILGKEWRTRQASCAALSDLLQGQRLEKYETYLEDVWNKCFKVLDDIKESVRAAAATLARSLTGILTRSLESDHSANKTASAMLKHVLPFLLSPSGMESSAQEVQLFAIHTLLEIIKKSNGQTLRPFIPELVERLIGLLSTMEPEAVNYIHLNASKYNLTEQKIDDMRLSSVRSSPIMEAIERCLDLLDDDTMQKLQPRLEQAMKSAVGLPSKVGASRVLVSLTTRRPQVFKASADHFLKVIEKLVLDRNETVASSYAASAGYVARLASEKQFLRLAAYINDLYLKTEGDREGTTPRKSITSGELVNAVIKHANDRFNAVAASFLPLVYLAKHDSNAIVKDQFQNAWNEAVGGDRAVQLYLKEILVLVSDNLDSAQWTLKHTAARSVSDATKTIAVADHNLGADTAAALWPVLEKALNGKTWDGKEVVLEAFVQFVENAKTFYQSRPDVASAIVKIALREAKRNNPAYRPHAVRSLARVAKAREDVDMSASVRELAAPLIETLKSEDPMDVDSAAGDTRSAARTTEIRDLTMAAAIEALILSINTSEEASLLAGLELVLRIEAPTAAMRKVTYQSLKLVFAKLVISKPEVRFGASLLATLKKLLFGPGSDDGSEALRLLRAEAVTQICCVSELAAGLRDEVAKRAADERSISVRDQLSKSLASDTS